MHWTQKAAIQRMCARLPRSNACYSFIQRRFGRLDADPFKRLHHHRTMLDRLSSLGVHPSGARCMEVGTGHLPIVPIGFYLAGASSVVTVDLHRRIEWALTAEMLQTLAASEDAVIDLYRGVVDEDVISARLGELGRRANQPKKALEVAGIEYRAPCDARRTGDADDSYDVHFSVTVLEHIDPDSLAEILREACRLLRPRGIAAHEIDLSDHFAHQDPSITRVNFLQYSDQEWARIAGNEFAYCNRLRPPQITSLFADSGLCSHIAEPVVDGAALSALSDGFLLDPAFRQFEADDVCTSWLSVYSTAS